jgi:hypothetical protein
MHAFVVYIQQMQIMVFLIIFTIQSLVSWSQMTAIGVNVRYGGCKMCMKLTGEAKSSTNISNTVIDITIRLKETVSTSVLDSC